MSSVERRQALRSESWSSIELPEQQVVHAETEQPFLPQTLLEVTGPVVPEVAAEPRDEVESFTTSSSDSEDEGGHGADLGRLEAYQVEEPVVIDAPEPSLRTLRGSEEESPFDPPLSQHPTSRDSSPQPLSWVQVTEEDLLTESQYRSRLRTLQQQLDEASHLRLEERNAEYSRLTREFLQREAEERQHHRRHPHHHHRRRPCCFGRRRHRHQHAENRAASPHETEPQPSNPPVEPFFLSGWSLWSLWEVLSRYFSPNDVFSGLSSADEENDSDLPLPQQRACDCLGARAGFHRHGCPLSGGVHCCDCLGASIGVHRPDCTRRPVPSV